MFRWIFNVAEAVKSHGDIWFYSQVMACAGLRDKYIFLNLKEIKIRHSGYTEAELIKKICHIINHEVLHHAIHDCREIENDFTLSESFDIIAHGNIRNYM